MQSETVMQKYSTVVIVVMFVRSWKVQDQAAVCHFSELYSRHRPHTGQRPAALRLEGLQYTAVRPVPVHRHHLHLRNQVGDIVRIHTALCMLRLLLLLVVCGHHCLCTVALC